MSLWVTAPIKILNVVLFFLSILTRRNIESNFDHKALHGRTALPLAYFIACASGGDARPHATALYQSCRLHCSCGGFFPSRSCRLAAIAFHSSKL